MALFSKDKKNGTPALQAIPEKKEMSMADPLKEALDDTKEATDDFIVQLTKLVAELKERTVEKGDKLLKKVRRASMTLTDELVDLRKNLP